MVLESSSAKTAKADSTCDREKLPYNPVTRKAIHSWYLPGQTYLTVFGDIATSLEECRAMLVGAYLMDDPELVSLFGYSESTEVTPAESMIKPFQSHVHWLADSPLVLYNTYLLLAVEGMEALQHFNVEEQGCPRFVEARRSLTKLI